MTKFVVRLVEDRGVIRGDVTLTKEPTFVLECLATTLGVAAKELDVPLAELLTDIWRTYHVQNRI